MVFGVLFGGIISSFFLIVCLSFLKVFFCGFVFKENVNVIVGFERFCRVCKFFVIKVCSFRRV